MANRPSMEITHREIDDEILDFEVNLSGIDIVCCVKRAFEEYVDYLRDKGNDGSISEFDLWVLSWGSRDLFRRTLKGGSLEPIADALKFFRDNTGDKAAELYHDYRNWPPDCQHNAVQFRVSQGVVAENMLAKVEEFYLDSGGGSLVPA